jgi:hypothetical protein
MLLLGSGLIGFEGYGRKKFLKKQIPKKCKGESQCQMALPFLLFNPKSIIKWGSFSH